MNTTGKEPVRQHHQLGLCASLRHIFFDQGNIDIVNNYFDELVLGTDEVKFVFIGSHYLNDIMATEDFNKKLNATPYNPDIGGW